MTESLNRQLIRDVVELTRRAGEAILRVYDASSIAVEHKQDESPLTEADMASHRVIVNGLRSLTPEWPVLSEESAGVDHAERRQWTRYWLVDPLDGTKEFIRRNGEFTVNIALIDGDRPVFGVVRVPVTGTVYWGLPPSGVVGESAGAWRQRDHGEPEAIRVREKPGDVLAVVGSRSHPSPELSDYLSHFGAYEAVPMGSSLKFCVVAEGGADIYPRLGPTSEWDTAAAQAGVEGAGGKVVKLDGEPLDYNRKASLLNPWFLVLAHGEQDWLGPARGLESGGGPESSSG